MRVPSNPRSAAAALVLAASVARAQGRPVWTEARTIEWAGAHAPAVRVAQSELNVAASVMAYGTMSPVGNPFVGLRILTGVPNRDAATVGAFVGIPFEVSGVRARWRDEAQYARRVAESSVDLARLGARAEARRAFVDVATAAERVRQTIERLDTAQELLRRMETRVRASAATELDRAMSEREVAMAEADYASARQLREAAIARFRSALDLAPGDPVDVATIDEPGIDETLTRDRAIALAVANRPELHIWWASHEQWFRAERRMFAESIAPVFVAAEFELQGYASPALGGSVSWSLPVLQLAQGQRAGALAEARAADDQRSLAEREVARNAAAAWESLHHRLAELHALRGRAIPALDATLAHIDRLHEAGAIDYFRVLVARRELAAVKIQAIDVLAAAWEARIALDEAMGQP